METSTIKDTMPRYRIFLQAKQKVISRVDHFWSSIRLLPAAAMVSSSSPYLLNGTSLVNDIQYSSANWAACKRRRQGYPKLSASTAGGFEVVKTVYGRCGFEGRSCPRGIRYRSSRAETLNDIPHGTYPGETKPARKPTY